MEGTPAMFAHRIEPEDQARADFYALLARLYQNAPDAALLEAIASAEIFNDEAATGDGAELARTWRALECGSGRESLPIALSLFGALEWQQRT